jgi:glyceraldehyde 3-phosphate dehydrogenase
MTNEGRRRIKVGINGLGRIGRAILRSSALHDSFDVVVANDINPDIGNIAYQLNYDTTYGRLDDRFEVSENVLHNKRTCMRVFHQAHLDAVAWAENGAELVIDASGVLDNVLRARTLLDRGRVSHVLVTHSPDDVDFTMVLGANQESFDAHKHRLVSASICDATALAPVLKCVDAKFGIDCGYITTLHPWLNYQNLSDGPASSWSRPGEIYHHYALGRASVGNMIPKPTSAVSATCKVLQNLNESRIGSFSYRTPTAIVGSADITLMLKSPTTTAAVIEEFDRTAASQRWKVLLNNLEPLVSLDFLKNEYSAVVDHRWTEVIGNNLLKLVLWYDNEWGYSTRVCDQVVYIGACKERR